jgi:hypothetical protein
VAAVQVRAYAPEKRQDGEEVLFGKVGQEGAE